MWGEGCDIDRRIERDDGQGLTCCIDGCAPSEGKSSRLALFSESVAGATVAAEELCTLAQPTMKPREPTLAAATSS